MDKEEIEAMISRYLTEKLKIAVTGNSRDINGTRAIESVEVRLELDGTTIDTATYEAFWDF